MSNIVGSLQVVLGLDSAEFVSGFAKADAVTAGFAAKQEKLAASTKKIVDSLDQQTKFVGRTAEEIKLATLASKGYNDSQLASIAIAQKALAEARKQETLRQQGIESDKKKATALKESLAAIDEYNTKAAFQTTLIGKTAQEVEQLTLAYRGATQEQLALAAANQKAAAAATEKNNTAKQEAADALAKEATVKAIQDKLVALQREGDLLTKSAAEIKLLTLAEEGFSEAQLAQAAAILQNNTAIERQVQVNAAAASSKKKLEQSARDLVASLTLEAEMYGKTADEIRILQLATQGLATSELEAVVAATNLNAAKRFEHEAAQKLVADANAEVAARDRSTKSVKDYIASLEQEVALIGKTSSQRKISELEGNGASPDQLAQVASLLKQADAAKAAAAAQRDLAVQEERASREAKRGVSNYYNFAAGQKLSALQAQQLSFQLNDFFVQVASGQSPLLALIQQGSQLNGQFGGVGGTFRALASVFTLARVAIGGVIGVLATVAYGFANGSEESAKFQTALTLTGNAAAITEGQFNRAAKTISDSTGSTIGSSRETLQSLVESGRFVGSTLTDAGKAIEGLSKVSGKEASAIISQFVSLADNVTQGAESLNKTYHFLTADQLKYIKVLDDQGESQKALGIVLDAFNNRLADTIPKLGLLARAYGSVKQAISSVLNAVNSFGADTTPEDKAEDIRKQIETIDYMAKRRGGQMSPKDTTDRNNLSQQLDAQNEMIRLQDRQNASTAKNLQMNESRTAFYKEQEKYLSNAEIREKEINRVKTLAAKGQISDADRDKLIANINERKKDPKPTGAGEATRVQREQRDAEIKSLQDFYARQKITIDYANKYLDTQYQVGLLDQQDYFSKQDALRNEEHQKQVDNLNAQIAVDKKFADQSKGSTKLDFQGKADETQHTLDQANLKFTEEQKNLELQRGEAVRQTQLRYQDLIATVKELSGDFAAADAIRSAAAAEEAKRTVTAAGGNPAVVDDYKKRSDQLKELQRGQTEYGELLAKQQFIEQSMAIAADVNGTSEIDQLRALGDERQKSITQLSQLVAKYTELAQKVGTPESRAFAQQLSISLQEAQRDLDPVARKLKSLGDDMGNSIAEGFADAIVEGKNLKDTINDIGKSITKMILNETFTKPVGKFFSDLINGSTGATGGGGGFLANMSQGLLGGTKNGSNGGGGIFGGGGFLGLDKLFGGGGAASASQNIPDYIGGGAGPGSDGGIFSSLFSSIGSLGSTIGSGIGGITSFIGSLFGFANGGDPPLNKPSIVGEHGPEIFMPRGAGTIIPNHSLGGSMNVTINQSYGPGTSNATMLQGAADARRQLEMAQRNL